MKNMNTLIKNCHLVDLGKESCEKVSILILEGKICNIQVAFADVLLVVWFQRGEILEIAY